MRSRRLAGLFALMSWTGPLLAPLAVVSAGGVPGCTDEVCACAHRAPSRPAAGQPCHDHAAAAVPDCTMSATCHHAQTAPLASFPASELPAVAHAAPPEGVEPTVPAIGSTVLHGFARLDPHPPPAA